MVVYLSLIPIFALIYTYLIPNDFYHTTIPLEEESISLYKKINNHIKDMVVTSIQLHHREMYYINAITNGKSPNGKWTRKEYFNYRLLVDYIDVVDSISLDNNIWTERRGFVLSSKSSEGHKFAEAIRYFNLNDIKVTHLIIGKDDIEFNIVFPDLKFKKSDRQSDSIKYNPDEIFDILDPIKKLSKSNLYTLYTDRKINQIQCKIPLGFEKPDDAYHLNSVEISCSESKQNDLSFRYLLFGWSSNGDDNKILNYSPPSLSNSTINSDLSTYLSLIDGFANNVEGKLSRMVYFSTVTITTLGYGDIVPITNRARILVSLESILGIIIIGLFLNSLAK